jgi:hypothetical protein
VSQGFLTIMPQYSIADCPKPDVIVIPGGGTLADLLGQKHSAPHCTMLARAAESPEARNQPGFELDITLLMAACTLHDPDLPEGQRLAEKVESFP